MNSYFKVKEKGSTISREILAGIMVFISMIYILPTNQNILSESGMNPKAVFIATALASALATIFMGLIAKYPVTLSAGMGLNAFFTFTLCGQLGYTWEEGLTVTLIAGVLFFIMTLTPIRKKIIDAIPVSLRASIIVGLGAFIAFVGLKGAGIIAKDSSTLVTLGDFKDPSVLLALFGVILVFVLLNVKSKISNFAIAISVVVTALIGFILGLCGVNNMPQFGNFGESDITAIKETFGKCFLHFDVLARPETYACIFSFIFVNLFDTTATLIGVGEKSGLINENGELIGGKKALLADAGGAVISGILGVSPVTSFVESNVGTELGGRTGLVALTSGILFLLSIFLFPVFNIFSYSSVTCCALVAVGALMFGSLKDVDWKDPILVLTSFVIVMFSILTYSISDGLGIGLIVYSLMMLVSKRGKEVGTYIYIISGFYIVMYIVNALFL